MQHYLRGGINSRRRRNRNRNRNNSRRLFEQEQQIMEDNDTIIDNKYSNINSRSSRSSISSRSSRSALFVDHNNNQHFAVMTNNNNSNSNNSSTIDVNIINMTTSSQQQPSSISSISSSSILTVDGTTTPVWVAIVLPLLLLICCCLCSFSARRNVPGPEFHRGSMIRSQAQRVWEIERRKRRRHEYSEDERKAQINDNVITMKIISKDRNKTGYYKLGPATVVVHAVDDVEKEKGIISKASEEKIN